VFPYMPSYLEQTAILQNKSFMNTHATDIGEVVGTNRPKFGPNRANGGLATPGGRSPLHWGQIGPSSVGGLLWASIVGLCRYSIEMR
jgi:hypothetical protein